MKTKKKVITMVVVGLLAILPSANLVVASPLSGANESTVASYTLDQAQEGINYGFSFYNTVIQWQEFRPTQTSLAKIDLHIDKNGNPGDLLVSVKDQVEDVLWDTAVAEGDIEGPGWLEVPVDPSISLEPGSSYYIYVWSDADSPSPDQRYFWRGQRDSDYDRGISSVESASPGYDFAFRTWTSLPSCVDFEDPPLGTEYYVKDVFTDSGTSITVQSFQWSNGQWTDGGYARVGNHGYAGGSGQEMEVNNVNLGFDFGDPWEGLSLLFGEYGGNLNIEINGDFRNFNDFIDINGLTIGDVNVVVNDFGSDLGRLNLSGKVNSFAIGGQELFIDDVCPTTPRPVIYFADHNEIPGSVYSLEDGIESVYYTRSSGQLDNLAFSPEGILYYSDASDYDLYKLEGGETLVYHHDTYLRDVAFDSQGRIYFSEASGGGDGYIYRLEGETASLYYTVKLADVEFWAGHFTFDRDDDLYLSNGNVIPANIYEVIDGVPVEVFSAPGEPIAGISFGSDGSLFYAGWSGGDIYKVDLSTEERELFYSNSDHVHLSDVFVVGSPVQLKPDLIVESITGPASAVVGEALGDSLTLIIKNIGTAEAIGTGGYFNTDLVLSSDDVIGNADDILLIGGQDQVFDALAPGQSLQVTLAGSNTIPAGTAPGLYYMGAVVDSCSSRVVESDEDNNTDYYYPIEIQEPAPLFLSLSIEDALEGVPVNKVVGDTDGPAYYTRLEIVTKISSWSSSAKDDIPVILTIPGDIFGAPMHTWVRDTNGDELTEVSYENLGGGQYRVTTDLSLFYLIFYGKQIVWRFSIPNDLLPQDVTVNAEIQVPCVDPSSASTIRILAPGSVRTLMIANRELLYDNYNEYQVTSLLQRLFTEAQGHPASHTPRAVIYYVERYHTDARDWDNTAVDYTSEATANEAANAIDDLIEDWHDDATEYVDIYISTGAYLHFPIAFPDYLLVVGDDDTIPFYRYDDPSNEEGIDLRDCDGVPGKEHPGWCVDSNTNPAVLATDEDYVFTDNPYADLGGGTDWQTGDVELYTGRLLGETAADMLSLLEEGVSWDNGDRGGVVMASVAGWELGLEHDPGGAGHIADLYDVPALFRSKGFAVRNDDIPAGEVRTIDVMSPYEGGDNSWNTNFRNAANDASGMDLFFIGGHNSYDHAGIPGDAFSPDDTCATGTCRYNRFDDDHPIAMIVGCHGGLPVRDGGGLNGGVDNDMVYDLIHEGVSGYIGATGFSYGSPGSLHHCTWGERLMQRFFSQLLTPPGGNSMALGAALAQAKSNYVFGYGAKDYYDRKTVTEFNLYGVPWTFIYYPSEAGAVAAASETEERSFTTRAGAIARIDGGVYSRIFEVDIDSYDVATETQNDIDYDLFSIEGGGTAITDAVPILPYVEGYHMPLPFGATVTNVEVLDSTGSDIGTYNVPIAVVAPWSEEGLTYTMDTDIDYPYPADEDLVQYQENGEGLLFTVFPIQHNPTTDETAFYSHFEIQVTYESPLAVVVTEFNTDKDRYVPGEEISTTADIANVGDVDATMTATLTIRDVLGEIMGAGIADKFIVPSGGSHVLPLVWSGMLDDGDYTVEITIESEGAVVGGASAAIWVVGGEITGLAVPEVLPLGEEGTFQVTFANHRDVTVSGEVTMTIQASEGGFAEELTPQPITVAGSSSETATFTWTPTGVATGDYNAVGAVAVDGQTYGPTARAFAVGSLLSLKAGWNMVSIPFTPIDNSTSAVFPRVAGIFSWNAASKSYYEPTVIEPEKGYWVAVTDDTTIIVYGVPVQTWTINIKAGWNMIGSISTNSSIADPNDEPDGSVEPPVYWWDPIEREYVTTYDIEPGKGYWVASVNDCTLTL